MHQSWQEIRALWRAAEERPRASRGAVTVLRRHFHEPRIVERMASFEDFINQTGRRSFVWGQSDCSLMVADWCVWVGHGDPAAGWRGSYDDQDGCRALLDERGGLADVVAACALLAGLKPIQEPEFGCVAVIGSPHRPERQWAAIWNGARWMVWFGNDTRVQWEAMSAKALRMWRV